MNRARRIPRRLMYRTWSIDTIPGNNVLLRSVGLRRDVCCYTYAAKGWHHLYCEQAEPGMGVRWNER
jgi:hypothetical protein